MEERPIAFQALHKDELIHEVIIRDVLPADDVQALRVQVRSLTKDIPSDSITSFEGKIDVELHSVEKKLKELSELIKVSGRPTNLKGLVRIQALAHHLYHRLTRLTPESEDNQSTLTVLTTELNRILIKLDGMFSVFKTSVSSDNASHELHQVSLPVAVGSSKQQSVSSLNLTYAGSGCVRAFIQRLEELSASRGITNEKLFASAVELFNGDVLSWYRSIKNELHSWVELRNRLVEEYLPYDYDRRLMQEIRTRTQGPNENIVTYISMMQNYFMRLSYLVPDKERFDIIYQNIRPEYSVPLCTTVITTLKQLKELCQMLECGKYRAQTFIEPSRASSGSLAPDLACKTIKSRVHAVAAGGKFCARCRVDSHTLAECTSTAIVCFRCGKAGVSFPRCPVCHPPSAVVPSSSETISSSKN